MLRDKVANKVFSWCERIQSWASAEKSSGSIVVKSNAARETWKDFGSRSEVPSFEFTADPNFNSSSMIWCELYSFSHFYVYILTPNHSDVILWKRAKWFDEWNINKQNSCQEWQVSVVKQTGVFCQNKNRTTNSTHFSLKSCGKNIAWQGISWRVW